MERTPELPAGFAVQALDAIVEPVRANSSPQRGEGLIATARHAWQKYVGLIGHEHARPDTEDVWLA